MPSLFQVGGYKVYFWSNENDEPIHVYVGMGKPSSNATKISEDIIAYYISDNVLFRHFKYKGILESL